MAANPIVYCLEQVSDYLEFERLSTDLMARVGYASIEPLGGFKDKGRDAIHVTGSGTVAIFCYSVREDWRAKLAEDAHKIRKNGHRCDELVFVTTGSFSTGQRDEAVSFIRNEYGWDLKLFGLERLRTLLEGEHADLIKSYPQIFTPSLFDASILKPPAKQRLFISCAREDGVLADWLTRRLTAEGYKVWCERSQLLGGEVYPDDVDDAITSKAFRFIALYSRASLSDQEVMRQRALALSLRSNASDFVIPLNLDGLTDTELDRRVALLRFISFNNWAEGLSQLLAKLDSIKCPKPLFDGRRIAAEAFLNRDIISQTSETLFSNILEVQSVPDTIRRFQTRESIRAERLKEMELLWAFRSVSPTSFLAFHAPPAVLSEEHGIRPAGGAMWRHVKGIDGVSPRSLASELLRKSLVVKLHDRGLRFCPESATHYFPQGLLKGNRLPYARPDGARNSIQIAGERTFWRPGRSDRYKYFLAPQFSVRRNLFGEFNILIRLHLRFTDSTGMVLPPRSAFARRKRLCRDWWNNDWINRIFAVCQYLGENGTITIADEGHNPIVIGASPISAEAPTGINEEAIRRTAFTEREDLLGGDEGDDDNDDEVEDTST